MFIKSDNLLSYSFKPVFHNLAPPDFQANENIGALKGENIAILSYQNRYFYLGYSFPNGAIEASPGMM